MKGHLFLPAFIAILAGYISFHIYSASWLARNFSLSVPAGRSLRLAFLLLAFLSPFSMFLKRHYTSPALEWIYAAGYSWMGIILLAGSMFFLADMLNPAAKRFFSPAGLQNFRTAVLAALGLIIAYSFYGGLKAPGLKEIRLAVPGLPPALEGLKIAQLSDLHLDSAYKLGPLAKTVALVNAQKPDLVFITGDLLDPGLTAEEQTRMAGLLRELKPRLGVFGVLGNHEYYFGYEKAVAVFRECGIKLLRNEAADAGGAHIIGVNDTGTERPTEKELTDTVARCRGGAFSILITHHPLMCDAMARPGDSVILAGHVHRAQIFPFHIFTKLFYKYFYGLYRMNGSRIYVTSGAGAWGPPMRFLAPSEVPLITLSGQTAR